MRLSGTVMEIWRLKNNGVTTLTFWGHVTSSVTWPFDSQWWLPMGVHCDHASIWHRNTDMAFQSTCTQTNRHTERRTERPIS